MKRRIWYYRHLSRIWLLNRLRVLDREPVCCEYEGCDWVGWWNDAGIWGDVFFCPFHVSVMNAQLEEYNSRNR